MKKINSLTGILLFIFSFTANAQVKKFVRDYHQFGIDLNWENWLYGHKDEVPATGKFIVYYDSSLVHKAFEGEFKQGKRNGTWTLYYANGRKFELQNYKDGELNGKQISFSYRGDTLGVTNRRNGKAEGSVLSWQENPWTTGKYLSSIDNYKNGMRDGWNIVFGPDGDTIRKAFYKNGHLQGKETYYSFGKITDESFEDSTGMRKSIHLKYTQPGDIYQLRIYLDKNKSNTAASLLKLDSLPFFTNLSRLDISVDDAHANEIPGIMEKLDAIRAFSHLRIFMLGGSFTQIPSALFECKQLNELHLTNTKIHEIPAAIAQLTSLRAVFLSGNNLLSYSAALKTLSLIPSLRQLDMPLDFGQPLPKEIALMQNLYFLSLGSYNLCEKDSSPPINFNLIYQLKNLRSFEVCSHHFWDTDQFVFASKMPDCQYLCYETCFAGGSMVKLVNGKEMPIENLRPGDLIFTYDTLSKRSDTTTVLCIFKHPEPLEGTITFKFSGSNGNNASITTTEIHPFFSSGKWIKAGDLKIGDRVLYVSADGNVTEMIIVEIDHSSNQGGAVYNLRTSQHTYFVNGVMVHNK